MSDEKTVELNKGISVILWLLRLIFLIVYLLLAYHRGWVVFLFLGLVLSDIIRKRKVYIILDAIVFLFLLKGLDPHFFLRPQINMAHFYLLQDGYEKAAKEYQDTSDYEVIPLEEYRGQELTKKQVVSYRYNDSLCYWINEKNLFLYERILVEEKDGVKTIFFLVDSYNTSGFMYIEDDEGRKILEIEEPYGEGEKSGFCPPLREYPYVIPCKYHWMNEHWLYMIKCIP